MKFCWVTIHVKDLEKSFLFYERALECQPDNEKLANQVESLKVQLAKQYFDEAVKFTRLGVLNQACNKIELARAYSPIIQDGALFNELIDNILTSFCRGLIST